MPKHGPKPSGWMTAAQVCAELGINLSTLYRFIDKSRIPAYRIGRVVRLQRDVDEFVEAARVPRGALRHLQPPFHR